MADAFIDVIIELIRPIPYQGERNEDLITQLPVNSNLPICGLLGQGLSFLNRANEYGSYIEIESAFTYILRVMTAPCVYIDIAISIFVYMYLCVILREMFPLVYDVCL